MNKDWSPFWRFMVVWSAYNLGNNIAHVSNRPPTTLEGIVISINGVLVILYLLHVFADLIRDWKN